VVLLPPVSPDGRRHPRTPGRPPRQRQIWGATFRDRGAGASPARTVVATVEQAGRLCRHQGHARADRWCLDAGGADRRGPVRSAHPTGMYRLYDADYAYIREYVEASRDPARFATYLAEVTLGGPPRVPRATRGAAPPRPAVGSSLRLPPPADGRRDGDRETATTERSWWVRRPAREIQRWRPTVLSWAPGCRCWPRTSRVVPRAQRESPVRIWHRRSEPDPPGRLESATSG
jgi:hypothetical protein